MLYPVIPVRDMVIFPSVIAPLFVSRPMSIRVLELVRQNEGLVFVTSESSRAEGEPGPDNLRRVGTVCKLLQNMRIPDGSVKTILEGQYRAKALDFKISGDHLEADVIAVPSAGTERTADLEALRRCVYSEFEKYVKLSPKIPDEVAAAVADITDADVFADVSASHSLLSFAEKQSILETADVKTRLHKLLAFFMRDNEMLAIERDIEDKVRAEMDKGQRQYYLHEKLKVIEEELGEDGPMSDVEEMKQKAKDAGMPEETEAKAMKEISRFSRMAPMSPEATVARTYIEWLTELPWKKSSEDHLDLGDARKILEEDHYGLEEVKERILEFLAVRKLAADNMRAQVICFVGPPGVGKTSLGKSIARTMGRKFVNMSLGGLRDEAEIRGHRRTYVGALPGRIIQKIKQAGTNNPVLLMDEIDKIGTDFRGDPAAALLEVLDPEQNCSFTDNFLEVSFDLSKVMFITTANSTATIPRPLLDRMEMIYLPGYVTEEKVKIAKRHLIPRILREHGLSGIDVSFSDSVLRTIISSYTLEAGVRGLDRQISKVARKLATDIAENGVKNKKYSVAKSNLAGMLGAPKLHATRVPKEDSLGPAIGLAWTEAGGDVILIESAVMNGGGHVSYTGNLGDIMQESAQTALAYLRSNADAYGLTKFPWQKRDIHIHVPEGAVPKDGPSAGITLALSLCSTLTGRRIDVTYAMTGEMTLHGEVLPIGGLREKLLAAKRLGIRKLIIPEDNRADVEELKPWVTNGMELHYVKKITQVFDLALKKK